MIIRYQEDRAAEAAAAAAAAAAADDDDAAADDADATAADAKPEAEPETGTQPASDPSGGAAPAATKPRGSLSLGEIVQVEIDENGILSWASAEVRQVMPSGRFYVCVNSDEVRQQRWPP